MKNLTTFGACAALSLAALTGAAQAEEGKARAGWYVALGAGANFIDDVDVTGGSFEMDTGYTILGAIGYDTGDITSYGKFRVETEVAYTENDNDSVTVLGTKTNVGGTLEQTTVMLNGYVDFVPGGTLRPYLGLGLGFVDGEHSISVLGFSGSGSGTEFAYRGAAGVTYHLTENWGLDLGYRYTAWESNGDVDNHSIVTSIRYGF
ncbi:MAG: outer membrane beta-barrel protein [Parvibaculum sp.]